MIWFLYGFALVFVTQVAAYALGLALGWLICWCMDLVRRFGVWRWERSRRKAR